MSIPVLYIGGTGRTGSTVIDKLLGSLPGVVSVGEMTWFWYALRSGGRCSCGERYGSCPMWSEVLREAFGGVDRALADRMYRLRLRHDSRHLPAMTVPAIRRALLARTDEYRENLTRLYQAILDVSGASVIVDSSKEPHYSYLLDQSDDIDVSFCHLVRHPVAVAYSWSRVRAEAGFGAGHQMETRGPVSASIYYDVSNLGAHQLWGSSDRYLRIRYEDFVADPLTVLRSVTSFGGISADPAQILEQTDAGWVAHTADVHSAWGNPNRFSGGTVRLRADDEWSSAAPEKTQRIVSAMTGLLAARYGYALTASGRSGTSVEPG